MSGLRCDGKEAEAQAFTADKPVNRSSYAKRGSERSRKCLAVRLGRIGCRGTDDVGQ